MHSKTLQHTNTHGSGGKEETTKGTTGTKSDRESHSREELVGRSTGVRATIAHFVYLLTFVLVKNVRGQA